MPPKKKPLEKMAENRKKLAQKAKKRNPTLTKRRKKR